MAFGDFFQTVLIPFGLFLIMMGMGLTLSGKDILRVFIMPKAVLIGLAGQMLMLPTVAFLLAFLIEPAPVIAIGLIILAACPGGITSNAYVFASRGDVALSVTLTSVASLICVFTVPFFTWLALTLYADGGTVSGLPVAGMMRNLAQLTVLPIAIGMLIRHWWPPFAARLIEPVRRMAIAILILVIIGNAIFSFDTLVAYVVQAGFVAMALNLSCMSLGFLIARGFRLNGEQTISITYEIGIQNLSLALVLANTILGEPDYAAVTLVYGFFMKVTALGFMAYAPKLKLRLRESGTASPALAATKSP